MSSYRYFAEFYDILTSNIPYKKRGEYFHAIIKQYNKSGNILLDLACGTGSLSEVMDELGYDVIGIDGSVDMLNIAMDKKYDKSKDIMYLCQDMRDIDLYGTIDVCICALDSINHITNKDDVKKVFQKVSLFLHPDGVFIFDVNTPYKHNNVLNDNTFVYDYDEVYCVWQNSKCKDNTIEISLDLFAALENNTYERLTENFSERAYTHEEICEFINSTNLELVDFFAGDDNEGFDKPTETTQRIVYVVKSTKNKLK